jgi:hypothetical protein
MPRRVPDDSAKELPAVWLGAKGLFRWPFDARFEAWGLAFLLTPACWLALTIFIPYPVVVAVASIALGRRVGRVAPEQLAVKRLSIAALAGFLIVGALRLGGPASLLLPMHWLLAGLVAPIVAVLLTRRIMRSVDHNRPLRYRVSVFLGRAKAPRRRRDVAEFNPQDEPHATPIDFLDDDPDPLDLEQFRTRLNFRKPTSLRKPQRPAELTPQES